MVAVNTQAAEPRDADLDAEHVEFLMAMDRWKRRTGQRFPSLLQILGVLRELGWRKVSPGCAPAVPPGPPYLDVLADEGLLDK